MTRILRTVLTVAVGFSLAACQSGSNEEAANDTSGQSPEVDSLLAAPANFCRLRESR